MSEGRTLHHIVLSKVCDWMSSGVEEETGQPTAPRAVPDRYLPSRFHERYRPGICFLLGRY